MYVRGKYGKSLKLDKLKETTPAAKDNLNTIGNSRTTPKEKAAKIGDGIKLSLGSRQSSSPLKKVKSGKEKRLRNVSSSSSLGYSPFDLANFSHFNGGGGEQMGGLLMVPPPPDSRIKEILNQLHSQQAALDHTERLKELEKQLGPEQAKMLLPFLEAQAAAEMIGQFSPEDGGRDPSALAAAAALARDMMSSGDSRESSPYQPHKEGSDDAEMTSDIDVDHSEEDEDEDDRSSSNSTSTLHHPKKESDENENATASDGELKRMQEPLTVSIPPRGNEIPA